MAINVNGFDGMIAGSLGLYEPWYVSKCYVDKDTMSMHIHVSVREGATIACPKCGGGTKRYGYEDETSMRHGHVYVSLFIDAENRSVADVEPGRDGAAVESFAKVLSCKGGSPENIKAVSSDLSRAFVPAIARCFPNAEHTIDKFHVRQIVSGALCEVRKQEQKETEDKRRLFLGRMLFAMPESRLTEAQRSQLAALSRQYPKTGRAHMILEDLDEFYRSSDEAEARIRLKRLCSWMRRCRLEPMKAAAKTLMGHSEKILNYFRNRLTNAICEGINSGIQAAKRKARGYKTFRTFSTMIYLIAGKLDIKSPFPLPI